VCWSSKRCQAVYTTAAGVYQKWAVQQPNRRKATKRLRCQLNRRYIVGHSPLAMYVAFQGTKQIRDWAANLSFRHTNMGDDDAKGKVRWSVWVGG